MPEFNADALERLSAAILAAHDDHAEAITELHDRLASAGLMSRVRLHEYRCRRGCTLAVAFRTAGLTLLAVKPYKLSPGLNAASSVATARESRTFDGDRHWRGRVFDVDDLAQWGESIGADLNCRHFRGVVSGSQVQQAVAGARPGYPTKPSILGVS